MWAWLEGVRSGEVGSGGGGGGGLNTRVCADDMTQIQTDGAPSWPGEKDHFRAALFLNSPKKTKKIKKNRNNNRKMIRCCEAAHV